MFDTMNKSSKIAPSFFQDNVIIDKVQEQVLTPVAALQGDTNSNHTTSTIANTTISSNSNNGRRLSTGQAAALILKKTTERIFINAGEKIVSSASIPNEKINIMEE